MYVARIDEYDTPLLCHMSAAVAIECVRTFLHNFNDIRRMAMAGKVMICEPRFTQFEIVECFGKPEPGILHQRHYFW